MEYNSTREKLIIPEYGRNVQKMIRHALTIEDRERRTAFVEYIAGVMTQMHISSGSYGDYAHMIWDHIHIIADYKLDVDSPYPIPDKETVEAKPKTLAYSGGKIKFRSYGSNIERMIKLAVTYEEGEEKDSLIKIIANHLKRAYLSWNRDSVEDKLIIEHLSVLSDGKLKLPENFEFSSVEEISSQKAKRKWSDNRSGGKGGARVSNKQNKNKQNFKKRQSR